MRDDWKRRYRTDRRDRNDRQDLVVDRDRFVRSVPAPVSLSSLHLCRSDLIELIARADEASCGAASLMLGRPKIVDQHRLALAALDRLMPARKRRL